jgi:hypothetical protein
MGISFIPISWEEYENHHGYLNAEQNLENRFYTASILSFK